MGANGTGKSTLLRTFNRMYSLYPDQRAEGEIIMDGENLLAVKRDVSLIRAKIGMVFQKPTPFPMTIYDNIAFGLRRSGMEGPEIGRRVDDELLEELETRLLVADVGVEATTAIIGDLTQRVSRKQLEDGTALFAALREDMTAILAPSSRPLLIEGAAGPFAFPIDTPGNL